jgi:integrase
MSKPRKLPSGRWQARYYVTEGGASAHRSAGTFATKRDAQDAINAELTKIRAGTWIDPLLAKVSIGDWAERWYAARPPSKKTRSLLDARILPKWKDWTLESARNLHVKTWVQDLVADKLAPETIRAIYRTFATLMADAARENMIAKSPCWPGRDGLPTVTRTKLHYLTVDEGRRLVEMAKPRYKAMFHLALWTGMRWGELAALRWEHVDLTNNVITVAGSVRRDRTIGPPKNGKTRTVVIADETAEVLKTHRRDFGSRELLFTGDWGNQLDYPTFRTRVMVPLVAKLKVDWPVTFHSLRHTYVSTMLESGVDALVVATEAGHSRASFTIDRYGHARHDADEVVRKAITEAMGR